MMGTIPDLISDLRGVSDRKDILKSVRRTIRGPLPDTRKAIKNRALRTLPNRGGLARWVASTRVTAQIKLTSQVVRVTIKGGRNSEKKRSDVNAIDRGRLRHPSWGRRGPGQWHNQAVDPGFFTKAVEGQGEQFRRAVDEGVSIVTERLNRG